MFYVLEIKGKQYLTSPGQKIKVNKITGEEGKEITLDKVLLKFDEKKAEIGKPYLPDSLKAKIVKQGKEKKKIVFRYHSKTRYRKKKGFRAQYTELEILK